MKQLFFFFTIVCLLPVFAFAQSADSQTISRSDFVVQAVQNLVGEINRSLSPNSVTFTDISESSKAAPYLQYALENGILSMPPSQRFFPEHPITRAEAIKVLIALLDTAPLQETARSHFVDIKSGMWSDPFVRSAEALCLVKTDRIVFLPDFSLASQTAETWMMAARQIKEQGSACAESIVLPPPPPAIDEVPEITEVPFADVRPTVGFVPPGSIPRNASNVPFLSLTITAPSTEAVTLDLVRITRQGLGDRNDFVGVKVLENGTLKGSSRRFSSDQTAELNLAYDPVRIDAGASATIVIAADMNAAEGGGEHEFVINDPEDIVLTGVESGEQISILGIFPIRGSSIDAANIETAQLTVEFEPVRNTLRYGRKRVEIARIRISETTGEQGASITSMRLSFDGMAEGGLKNLFVELDDTIISSVLEQTDGRQALFSFPAGAISINRGDDIRLIVHADIYVIDNDFRVFFDNLASDLKTTSLTR